MQHPEPRDVTEIELDKKCVKPRVTPASIDAQIKSVIYLNAYEAASREGRDAKGLTEWNADADLKGVTLCFITLRNGFTVIGHSGVVYDENFDGQIGRDLAYKHAYNQIWPFEGYVLACERVGRVMSTADLV